MVIPEGHVLATLSIVRREPLLSPEGNQASIQVHNESSTNISLLSSLPLRATLPSPLPALRHTSSIPSHYYYYTTLSVTTAGTGSKIIIG